MGEVKDAVSGSPPASKKAPSGNLTDQVLGIADELSRLTAIKDDDAATEGDAAKPENIRKATILRAAHSLLRGASSLLRDY